MPTKHPNLLFLMTDHQRWDSLGMVQAEQEVTPNLNKLAGGATVFSRAYNTCPLCVPARTALATSVYPTHDSVFHNDWNGRRAGNHVPIHQVLAEAGYMVGHIGVDHIRLKPGLRERLNFDSWIGSQEYSDYAEELSIEFQAHLDIACRDKHRSEVRELRNGEFVTARYSNTYVSTWPHPLKDFRDVYYCRQAASFLRGITDRPFALFVNLWSPHPPLRVPEPYASLFPPDQLELPPNVGLTAQGEPANRRQGAAAQLAEGITAGHWRRVWAAHLGLTRLADDGLGSILEALSETGQADRTAVVFTSDHGDHLGQHRMYQKMELYEQAIHVPLLLRFPGVEPNRFDAPVSHLDVMPTLLDLLDIKSPGNFDGRSSAANVLSGTAPPDRPVFAQYSGNPEIGDLRRAIITRRYKYIYDPRDIPELYDLENDPLEMENLAGEESYRGIQRELHDQCARWAREHGDWVAF